MRTVSLLTTAGRAARLVALALGVTLGLVTLATPARAQERVILNAETKSRTGLYPIAVAPPVDSDPRAGKLVTETLSFDLKVSSWFKLLDPRSFLAGPAEGMGLDPQRWKDVGAFGVIKFRAVEAGASTVLQFKLYELGRGARPALEREYKGKADETRRFVHQFANEVVRYYTGELGFAGSQLAFVQTRRRAKAIVASELDGSGVRAVSNNPSVNILPAWSPSGNVIAYTSYMRNNPDVYLWSATGGRARPISRHPGMNTGASFSPDGSQLAVTLSKDGNAEIYVISASDGRIVRRLTNNRAIDASPAWSPDGKEIAFVSNREGGPQVFVMNADGSGARRVSTIGGDNTTPAWSPRRGTRVLAYTARDDVSGRYDIVTLDLATSKMTRVTQNQGNNEEPTWSPNGRVLAFASTRSGGGIYLANADGTGEQVRVYQGGATAPDWSRAVP